MGTRCFTAFIKTAVFVLVLSGIVLGVPHLSPSLFPDVGKPSVSYDCDDETLDMYRHFEKLGIKSVPVVGNLETTGESLGQSNHIWLLVGSGPHKIAYDWGTPRFDRQHYEGFTVSLEYLLYAVLQDNKNPDLSGIAENN